MDPSWVRLTLDVETFDPTPFADAIDRCLSEGIVLTTIAELGDTAPNHRRLYDLNRICSADIPRRGEFSTYAEYCVERIERNTYNPTTIVIALDRDKWVGMSAASDHRDRGFFFNEMTGVLRSHRGRGVALALKVLVINRVHELGVPTMHTVHHPDNTAPIALNRRLGYLDTT